MEIAKSAKAKKRSKSKHVIVGIVSFVLLLGIPLGVFFFSQYSSNNFVSQNTTSSVLAVSFTPTPTFKKNPTPTKKPTPTMTVIPVVISPVPEKSSTTSYPAQVLNLTNWKVTLPVGVSEKPAEIRQPALSTYLLDPWFVVLPVSNAVRFRAPVNSVTTSGSNYPRSELREMINNGSMNASWSSTTGTHTMYLEEAITAVPQTKKHVVAGQIHDSNNDIIVIRLEYPNLYVNVDGKNLYTLDSNYSLGKKFTVKFAVSGGQTKVYYNDSNSPVYTLDKNYSDAYFKAGAYTQSNCTKETVCASSNYGEVVIYKVTVTHQ